MLGPEKPVGCYRMVDILAMRTYIRLALHVKNVAFVKKTFNALTMRKFGKSVKPFFFTQNMVQ